MAHPIIWTKEANNTLHELTNFLAEQWEFRIVAKFVDAACKAVEQLATSPELGRISNPELDIRYITIKPYTKLYYKFDAGAVVLIEFIDTRQEPDGRFQ